jgi:uncharacterized damage-inducible protein DinB
MIRAIPQAALSESTARGTAWSDLSTAVDALVATQRQLAEVVAHMSDGQYQQRPVGEVASSVGSHVRHCLDHLTALLDAARTGSLNYDDRRRDTQIERSRHAALTEMRDQERRLLELSALPSERRLCLTTLVSCDASPIVVRTSLGRELAFVLSHSIHHGALIAVMARSLQAHVPQRFGYAPATLASMDGRRCAP